MRDSVILAARKTPMRIEEAAESLASLPKPLACTAEVGSQQVMVINCDAMANEAKRSQQLAFTLLREGLLGPARAHHTPKGADVLVVGRDETMLVGLEALESWLRDYRFPAGLGLSGREPREQERAGGARYVMQLGRTEVVDIDTVLDKVRRSGPPGERRRR